MAVIVKAREVRAGREQFCRVELIEIEIDVQLALHDLRCRWTDDEMDLAAGIQKEVQESHPIG